ncbi:hypothetical protein [Nevskia sp.]|uniref:hypothetical protein n=1 Tax=Nevskia sp. TaxID=1929292 RepID=UPI0025DA3024|nr:hypothetical protein [Nevskia sp.]
MADAANVVFIPYAPSLIDGTPTVAHIQKGDFSAELFAQVESMASFDLYTPDDLPR